MTFLLTFPSSLLKLSNIVFAKTAGSKYDDFNEDKSTQNFKKGKTLTTSILFFLQRTSKNQARRLSTLWVKFSYLSDELDKQVNSTSW